MTTGRDPVSIVGAGPTGALLAVLLHRRGYPVTLYESRPDPRGAAAGSGRSINLALADRGIHALKTAGAWEAIVGTFMPMRGRMVHQQDGTSALQPYGRRPSEVIYSISRERLNRTLVELAAASPGVDIHFEHRLESTDFVSGTARILDIRRQNSVTIPMRPLIAADGAGSAVRRRMAESHHIEVTEEDLAHGYKELAIPAGPQGRHRLAHDALHIWPRGNFMLIALPNADGSFTATLFLARRGPVSFAALDSAAAIERFLQDQFPDVYPLMPDCVAEFQNHPLGFLGTVHAAPWHARGMAALIGDAAHAIVPFHGQGMNCCFEDCVEFAASIARHDDWESAFVAFHARRKPDTDAIADMALENYGEMRERVADPNFRLQHALALELERRFPRRFIPRYSMVTFHHEIPYRVAQTRGMIQARLLAELTAGAATLEDIDYDRARRVIHGELPPVT